MEPLMKDTDEQPIENPSVSASTTKHLRLLRNPHAISRAALDRFATGRSLDGEKARVVRHLLAGCPDCRGHLISSWTAPVDPRSYDAAFERSLERAWSLFEERSGTDD